ncbi:1-(5-phosphoribosyl)-5-[(5-phosphoribosylamino)methylideneamino]imidazole-4-carboxamide isomerase [Legionella anisa]|uniref:1-(5-phosphoribosyl)-5-[(5-phosphoribosylamino)methylideneamino] imidazole-4-carboxamide isomerase n=1 Tax=Legionella anisa TaxID=28082 RepID=A0AAX0WT74_9GAMM|nr:1-(5-phosphoribosyl)-5-[(5-phosphoribosylamino)methylideneamino]imidazole-4-carboxamide isomerase [Legionella anisa]AWN74568.1 1-(5-phosphoribosyl)-5-[(5-phosphoribosylamino)methylideneamino]imidazole-4-carboxamide isomerase [Legionella anisa]KTC76633.1 phosphoribosylformimino-5-aminoimidazole carboxamide ribotide isomerase [Legionella anisa]MBN5937528.1 1-(5-phosphoribosyl)-5-[(5-phosphoribosylamino)methylideneamino]imidazole-4-carboxamide isomerase [Legionella anisa]MCW8425317.1 1-(5-phosp
MILIPAIDIQTGRCVRLRQGQFDQVTQFDTPPVERAAYFAELGAKRLHVVDLDGAQTGTMQQLPLICAMQNTGIVVQAGGGIRSLEQAITCFSAGISNLVLGSIAISNPELTALIIKEINPQHIILALDIRMKNRIPIPAIHGWQTTTNNNLWDVVSHYQQLGIKQILCTDIACDGMMQGPNFELYKEAIERFPRIEWQASGGIRDADDINRLDSLGVNAVILGLTLYQGTFDLRSMLL